MAKTRRGKAAGTDKEAEAEAKVESSNSTKKTPKKLDPDEENPPQAMVMPKDASSEARIATLPNPATTTPNRYFICPEKGFYEFTRVAAPKQQKRSWLLAPERSERDVQDASIASRDTVGAAEEDSGYVLQVADMFVATPLDPLFLLLPALSGDDSAAQEFLASSDFIAKMGESSPHFAQIIESSSSGKLRSILGSRIQAVSDCMDMGDDKMYALSLPKLVKELVAKAMRMTASGLPATMEDRFVKQALDVPVLSVKREDSNISIASEDASAGADSQSSSAINSQESISTDTTKASVSTAATSLSVAESSNDTLPPADIVDLLRIRVAIQFMSSSYIIPKVGKKLAPLLADAKTTGIDFAPLDKHLAHIATLKKQAQALRSLSDNISRKRASENDDEAVERAAEKRRKKEEEEAKKKSVPQAVKKLMKADTSGMKKMSSFFTKAAKK